MDDTTRENILGRLTHDCTLDEVQYHLYVPEKIRRGLESAETEPMFSQEEMETRLRRWLPE